MTKIFGLSEEVLKAAMQKYKDQIKPDIAANPEFSTGIAVAKEIIRRTKEFFEKETPELKKWLIENGFLIEEEMISVPRSFLENLFKALERSEQLISEVKSKFNAPPQKKK